MPLHRKLRPREYETRADDRIRINRVVRGLGDGKRVRAERVRVQLCCVCNPRFHNSTPSLRATRSNLEHYHEPLDCFALLAKTKYHHGATTCEGFPEAKFVIFAAVVSNISWYASREKKAMCGVITTRGISISAWS